MYHEEKWIDGKLYWRVTPEGEWIAADADMLNRKLLEAQAEAKTMKGFADLWYFAMDSAPGDFERIVTTCHPSLWMHKIAAIRRGERA